MTTFAQPVNNFSTTLASQHASGSGTLVLSASPGTLASNRIWRVTALANPDTPSEAVLGIFEATSNTGATLSGVTAAEGTSDSTLAAGTTIRIYMTAKDLAEVQAAIEAIVAVRDAYLAYDDFAGKADGAIGTLLTGQTWIQGASGSPIQTATIVGGTMGAPTIGAGAAYPTVDLGAGVAPDMVWTSWHWASSGTIGSAVGLIVSTVSPIAFADILALIHLAVGQTTWSLGIYDTGTLTPILSGTFSPALATDGVSVHTVAMRFAGNTATVYLPDGNTATVTDARIGAFRGRYVTYEPYVPVGTNDVRFHRAAAVSRTLARVPVPAPALDDLWPLVKDALAVRPTLGANTFSDVQTIDDPAGGFVWRQDSTHAFRMLLAGNGNLYFQTSGDGFATALPLYTAGSDGGVMFGGKVAITPVADDYALAIGTAGFQTLGVNNTWFGDNLYFDGSAFKYKGNGFAAMSYFASGGWSIYVSPNNVAGPGATITVLNQALHVAPSGVISGNGSGLTNLAAAPPAFSATIGDGATNPVAVAHGLGTRDVAVTLRQAASPYGVVLTYWEATDADTVTLHFSGPPSSGEYRVHVSA